MSPIPDFAHTIADIFKGLIKALAGLGRTLDFIKEWL